MSNVTRAVIGGLAVVVAVVLFVVLQGEGTDDSPEPTTTTEASTPAEPEQGGSAEKPEKEPKPQEPEIETIRIEGGAPVGGVAELEFDKGDTIEFFVESDVADHVHLHGYDVMQDVAPGQRVKFSVPAAIDGVFEAELEDRVVPIAEITVNP